MLRVQVTKKPNFSSIQKNIRFGVAVGLTKTAKDGQTAVLDSLKSTFELRGSWFNPGNKFGIKIKGANKTNMEAQVRTLADWLVLHETGGVKRPRGENLAIPTENVRRNKRLIIPRGQRPAALRNKRTFVLHTKRGKVLFQRKYKGKRSQIVALYNLEPRARIRKESTFFAPIRNVVNRSLMRNITAEVKKALASAR